MQQEHNIENSIIPATFTALTVKFYALQLLSALLSPCAFSSAASKRLAETDISIAQKTCVFRPVDISVAVLKRNKLIYQSVYSLLEAVLPQSKPIGFASSLWEGAFGIGGKFLAKVQSRLPGSTPSVCSLRSQPPSPRGRLLAVAGNFAAAPKGVPLGELARERLRGLAPPRGSCRAATEGLQIGGAGKNG